MSMKKLTPSELIYNICKYAFLILLVIVFILPILTVLFASFKTGTEY